MDRTVAQKLESLMRLQSIDSELDEIKKVRGDLPEEVRDLEDEIAGYETRISKFTTENASFQEEITKNKQSIKESEKLIKKYLEQQQNVRNNREFEAIAKEIEVTTLDIQICEKRMREATLKIERKNDDIEAIKRILVERKKDLESKKSELEVIIAESQEDENKLMLVRDEAAKEIEERLLYSYDRVRSNAQNGLAVVVVKRDACGGCFNRVPPQRQADIREKKKIIVCEHCGRILAEAEQVVEQEPAPRTRRSATAAE